MAWFLMSPRLESRGMEFHLQRSTDANPYPGQFVTVPDLFFIAIPRSDIMAEIMVSGETRVLEDLYLSVSVIAEVVGTAMGDSDH